MCGTYDQGITYCDHAAEVKNKLIGWVDSDFGSDPDTRKSMTGYLMSLNGDAISSRSPRQGGVPLSSSEAEFVGARQAGQEVVYLRELLKGFHHPQKEPTGMWEHNASCIMMSENSNRKPWPKSLLNMTMHYVPPVPPSNISTSRSYRSRARLQCGARVR